MTCLYTMLYNNDVHSLKETNESVGTGHLTARCEAKVSPLSSPRNDFPNQMTRVSSVTPLPIALTPFLGDKWSSLFISSLDT